MRIEEFLNEDEFANKNKNKNKNIETKMS